MKKLLSLLLSVMLLTGAALPAAAAEATADAKLTEITQSVKATLALDTEDYSHFQGNYSEQELTPMWDLYWDGDSGSLSVTALEDGTITRTERDEIASSGYDALAAIVSLLKSVETHYEEAI